MGRHSSVTDLDPRIKDAVDIAIAQRRATIDEICRTIRMMGGAASRSAVGRYSKSMKERLEKFRETQAIAGEWMQQIRADPDGDIGRMLAEMLKLLAFRTQTDMQEGEGEGPDPKSIALLARAIDQMKMTIEQKVRDQVAREAADCAERAGREAGLTGERLALLRLEVLGLRPAPGGSA